MYAHKVSFASAAWAVASALFSLSGSSFPGLRIPSGNRSGALMRRIKSSVIIGYLASGTAALLTKADALAGQRAAYTLNQI